MSGVPPKVAAVLFDVAQAHSTTVEAIRSPSRLRRHAYARQEACARLRRLSWCGDVPSYPQIGRWLNRDHSTVIYGARQHEARRAGA